jgi:hypothetical protein
MGDMRGAYKVLVERLDRKRPLVRYRSRWENNLKLYLQEAG